MELQELRDIICTDLAIMDHTNNFTYTDVDKFGGVFYNLRHREVIGLRITKKYLLISIK